MVRVSLMPTLYEHAGGEEALHRLEDLCSRAFSLTRSSSHCSGQVGPSTSTTGPRSYGTVARTGSWFRPRMTIRVFQSGVAGELDPVEAVEEGGEHRLGLEPGEVRAEAGVHAGAELQVLPGVGSGDVDVVDGVAPPGSRRGWRSRGRVDDRPGGDRDGAVWSVEVHVAHGDAAHELVRVRRSAAAR